MIFLKLNLPYIIPFAEFRNILDTWYLSLRRSGFGAVSTFFAGEDSNHLLNIMNTILSIYDNCILFTNNLDLIYYSVSAIESNSGFWKPAG